MLLIGLGNKCRQGKDIAAEAIRDYYNRQLELAVKHNLRHRVPTAEIFKFAESLYEECRCNHGMIEKDAPLLQRVGTERRAQDPEYWIKRCFDKIWATKPEIALISDVRYQNEAQFIRQNGGYLINVSRVSLDGTPFISADRPADHPSETELDDYEWDYFIKARSGQSALVGELAITTAAYLWSLHS